MNDKKELSEDYLNGYAKGVADTLEPINKAYKEGYAAGYSDAEHGNPYSDD